MKRAWLLVVLLSVVAAAQEAAPPPPQSATTLVQKETAPSYADMYCAGFITNEPINRSNVIVAGAETPNESLYATHDFVFLKGSGYALDQQLTVVRELTDPNRFEAFTGQHALLRQVGQPYAEMGRVRVAKVDGPTAVAKVEFACAAIAPGDFVIPFQERPPITARKEKLSFDRFPASSAPAGRIVMAKDFDLFVGTGSKVYITAGAQRGIRVGDYLRITRGYSPADMDPAAAINFKSPAGMDTQKKELKLSPGEVNKLPRQAVGELVILSVTPSSATGMITFALDTVRVGDTVETEVPQQ